MAEDEHATSYAFRREYRLAIEVIRLAFADRPAHPGTPTALDERLQNLDPEQARAALNAAAALVVGLLEVHFPGQEETLDGIAAGIAHSRGDDDVTL